MSQQTSSFISRNTCIGLLNKENDVALLGLRSFLGKLTWTFPNGVASYVNMN